MKTFWDRIRHKIINQWIYKRDQHGNIILLYITGTPSSQYVTQFYPGYYCIIKRGSRFDYRTIKELYHPDNEDTRKGMRIQSLQEVLSYTTLKDNEIKEKLVKHFSKRLLTL